MDDLRSRFKAAFEAYVREGKAMTDLLLRGHREGVQATAADIDAQQARLTAAKEAWEIARRRYVQAVLAPTSPTHL